MAKRKAAAVSMTPEMQELARQRAESLGFSTFSGYVNALIRKDLMEGGDFTINQATKSPEKTTVKKSKKTA